MDQFYVGIPANGMADARMHWSKPFGKAAWKAMWDVRYHRFYSPSFDALYANEVDAVLVFNPTKFVKASFGWSGCHVCTKPNGYRSRLAILNFSPTIRL